MSLDGAIGTSPEPGTADRTDEQAHRSMVIAGAMLAAVGIGIVLSIIVGESVYPARYTTFANTISDLSGTEPPHSVMREPSRTIFIVTMLLAGVGVLVADRFLARANLRRGFVIAMGVFGVGLVGIGIFPGNVAGWHPLFALACFLGGSVATIMSRKVIDGPFRFFAAALGSVALVATVFALEPLEHWGPQDALGRGGIERWIAYPVLLWMVGFGAVLMSRGVHVDNRTPGMETGT